MIDLVVITESFPFNNSKESFFINPEIDFYKNSSFKDDIKTIYLPTNFNSKSINRYQNIAFDSSLKKSFSNKGGILARSIFFIDAYIELARAIFKKPLLNKNIFYDIKSVIRWIIQYKATQLALEKLLQHDSMSDNVCIYTYWFTGCTSAAIDLRKNTQKNIKVISRAHGYDLYEHRGWKPRRSFDIANIDKVFPVSEAGAKYLSQNSTSDNIEPLYLGVSAFKGSIHKKNISRSTIKVCSCSYLNSIKRVDLIAASLQNLAEKNKNIEIIWHHFGGGAEEKKVRKTLNMHPHNLNFHLYGDCDNEFVRDLMNKNNYSAFINASSSEGLPVSLMEALEAGIPLVAANVGGNSEIATKDVGFLIPANPKPNEIADAVLDCHNNYGFFSENAKKQWGKKFNSEKNHNLFFSRIIDIFKKHS